MANNNARKGRAAERCAQRYLEALGWRVLDTHANDAMEGLTNADLLAFPDGEVPGDPETAVREGLEIQVKYSSVGRYGATGVYNRHEREGVELGSYATEPADADAGDTRAALWGRYEGWVVSGSLAAFWVWALYDETRCYEVPNVLGKQIRECVAAADAVMLRQPRKPWVVVWRAR